MGRCRSAWCFIGNIDCREIDVTSDQRSSAVATCSSLSGEGISETNNRHWSHGCLLFYEQLQ